MSFVYKFIPEKTHVFIHIPKNGGSSLIESLRNYNPYINEKKRRPNKRFVGHLSYQETLPLFPKHEPLSFFCITRNPWERMVSYFHYLKQFKDHHSANEIGALLDEGLSFDEFIEFVTFSKDKCIKTQFQYMSDKNGSIAIDDTLRLENIQGDLNELLKKNNCQEVAMEKLNSSKHKAYTDYYKSDHSIKMVSDYEAGIIDLCQYRFGD